MVHSRNKGRNYERAVYNHLVSQCGERHVEQRNRSGHDGDDLGLGNLFSLECKNQAQMNLAGWVDQAVAQRPEDEIAVVVHKRKGRTDVGEHYVTMRVCDFIELSKLLRAG